MSSPVSSVSTLSADDLDVVYSDFCHTMTRIGEAQAPLFMARFALLAMVALGDRAALQRMVQQAAADLPATRSESIHRDH
ncbi:hypothetical protein GCM10010975_10900 [Comamonas phosphati]|nr:hypothetical protein GCM10010975_10900 [Comamonas phosphati]